MQTASLQTAQVSHEVLLNLYANEDKPNQVTPLDLALVSYLIARRAFDHEIYDSQQTLALRLSTDYKAVRRSLIRLDGLGWITYRGQGIGRSKGIALNLDRLPAAQPIRDKITPDAGRLVDFYIDLKKSIGTKRFPKDWRQRQLPSAQRIITLYGDHDSAAQRVAALFNHADHGIQAKARKSLYNLLQVIPRTRRLQQQERSRVAREQVTEVACELPTHRGQAA